MKRKYLLSTGLLTDRVEYYIIDLFKLHLSIYPKDIPGADWLGFDFILSDIKKDELKSEVIKRLEELVNKIQKKFTSVKIEIAESALVSETRLKLVLNINQVRSEEILVDLYDNK